MIRIRVFPGPFGKKDLLDEDEVIVLPDDSTVGDLLKAIGIPKIVYKMGFYSLNYKQEPLGKKLSDGDTLSFLAPLAGG
ncbi:MoaD/ThiS family protein [Gudongella sp. DL1XJH-153]|uniref:MoaD/ThiS family protein n=1 Tax=Gudongella sp. DL1XJH-153 TaxID=3409804 RepID=UPI003BB6871E